MANKNSIIYMDEQDEISAFVQSRSVTMYEYMVKSKSQFTLWYKPLAHSDLTNRGKRNGAKEGFEKNYLYYLSVEEMEKIQEQFPEKPFESAKQSNIGMPMDFYLDLGIPRLERRKGKQKSQHSHIIINEFVDVMIVNDTMEYFKQEHTARVLKRLNKYNRLFCDKNNIILNEESPFTEIQLTEAIHGLGTADDIEFHK